MSKINLKEFQASKRAAEAIHIETDTETFVIDPPSLWSDEMMELAQNADNLALCKALLGGEEGYARFVAAGGGQATIGAIISDATSGFSLGKSPASLPSSKTTAR